MLKPTYRKEQMKFTKIRAGWYATADGRYAVIRDITGYVPQAITDITGEADDGWCLAFDPKGNLREDHQAGSNIDWFDTKREAVAYAVRDASRQAGE